MMGRSSFISRTRRFALFLRRVLTSPSLSLGVARFYCGFQDAIEIFDITRPGASGHRQHMSPSKKNKSGMKGSSFLPPPFPPFLFSPQPFASIFPSLQLTLLVSPICVLSSGCPSTGIISALAFSPDPSNSLYAAGSFSRSLALYTEKTGAKQVLTFRGLDGAGVTSVRSSIPFSLSLDSLPSSFRT